MNQKDKDYIEYVKLCQLVRKTMAKADQAIAKMEEQSAKEEQMQSDEQEKL